VQGKSELLYLHSSFIGGICCGLVANFLGSTLVMAQAVAPTKNASSPFRASIVGKEALPLLVIDEPYWETLSQVEKLALRPLQKDWLTMPAEVKRKWLVIAQRFPLMKPDEKERIQTRMVQWSQMDPKERNQARLNFQAVKRSNLTPTPQVKQAQWEAYQALSFEEKQKLTARALAASETGNSKSAQRKSNSTLKPNETPNPNWAPRPTPVTSTMVQARPGATTVLVSKDPTSPAHQQTGLPKIAATPDFIDPLTLLPKRGAQAAASRHIDAPASVPRP
jgi:hypothetical protein